jgi:uncharacterized protein
VPLEHALLAVAIVAAASALQASIGFGLAIVAAPLLALLDRGWVPGPLIAAGTCLSLIMVIRERHELDLDGVGVAAAGRVLGAIPASYALSLASQETFDLLFGVIVLAAVGISMLRSELRTTPRTIFVAGVASGIMGTITSIGGPPVALAYQSERGPRLRATLAGMFLLGSMISLAALAAVGRFGAPELVRAAVLVPGVVVGAIAARPLLHRFDAGSTRPLVLGLSAGSALLVLARALS